jgi:hypothetical protein
MSVKIIMLSDGETWETVNGIQQILEITDEAYDRLCEDVTFLAELQEGKDILSTKEVK